MTSPGSLASLVDQWGNVTGPYLFIDGPMVPADNPGRYDYSSIGGPLNMWYYVLMSGEKIIFILSGWGSVIPFDGGRE